MSQPPNDDNSSHSHPRPGRHRSNTSSLLNWRRHKFDHAHTGESSSSSSVHSSATASVVSPIMTHPLTVDQLIEALLTAQFPNVDYARSLASALSTHSPLPHPQKIISISARLCCRDATLQLQISGFDIIAAYWESSEVPRKRLGTADRMTFFAFFEDNTIPWQPELWESRFKALRSFTEDGLDINGLEYEFLRIVTNWIDDTFAGLLLACSQDSVVCEDPFITSLERTDITERERCLDIWSLFLIKCQGENIRFKELSGSRLRDFYVSLLNRAIDVAPPPSVHPNVSPRQRSATYFDSTQPFPSSSGRLPHRRNISSVSGGSIPSPSPSSSTSFFHGASTLSPPPIIYRAPQERAIQMYLDAVRPQLRGLYPSALNEIMPVLFRSMAYALWPLQRLNVHDRSRDYQSTLEAKIMDVVHDLLAGPYHPAVMQLIKRAMYAPIPPESPIVESTPTGFKDTNRSASLILLASIQKSHGAFRILRSLTRRALSTRMARAYIGREVSGAYSHSGAPTRFDLDMNQDVEQELLDRAWGAHASSTGKVGWDAATIGKAMKEGVRSWVEFEAGRHTQHNVANGDAGPVTGVRERIERARERVLEEAASIVRDVFHELDDRDENGTPPINGKAKLEPDEAITIGGTLNELAQWIRVVSTPQLPDSSLSHGRYNLPLGQPSSAPTPLLQSITTLLSRDHTTILSPPLSSILWDISDHLSDEDSVKLPAAMMRQKELEPVTVSWINNWRKLLLGSPSCGASTSPGAPTFICSVLKPMTVNALISSVEIVYDNIKDIKSYRRPLAGVLLEYCRVTYEATTPECLQSQSDSTPMTLWNLLAEEIVLRQLESLDDGDEEEQDRSDIEEMLNLLFNIAGEEDIVEDSASLGHEAAAADLDPLFANQNSHSIPPASASTSTFGHVVASPVFSRKAMDIPGATGASPKDLMSLLSSFTGVKASTSASPIPPTPTSSDALQQSSSTLPDPPRPIVTRQMGAISTLTRVFASLAFTPSSLEPRNVRLVLRIFSMLCTLASPVTKSEDEVAIRTSVSPKARVAALQFLMRLRADRDHHLYLINRRYDENGSLASLASLIYRGLSTTNVTNELDSDSNATSPESSRVRKAPPERLGRRATRGSRGQPTPSAASRSRSRIGRGVPLPPPTAPQKPRIPLWGLPEVPPFSLNDADNPSEGLTTYDPDLPDVQVLPISDYLELLRLIMQSEFDWEILSYVLCHFPVQLANKHLFCGPVCRKEIGITLNSLIPAIFHGGLGAKIEYWPPGLKARDAQGLGYHTLSVLISYKKYFDSAQRHRIVEVLQLGLNAHPTTIKCCLQALSSAAFELQPSMTKYITPILQKLSEIMSNTEMAVHILGFLSIVGSLRPLQANFTEADYKMVFGVALRYLQLHSTTEHENANSWALAQHVRILSYSILYVWFLAIKVPDRARHIPYITRQLLLANEGRKELDDATEVCFDWLARYTYGSADPRPANSTLSDVIMDPASHSSPELPSPDKAWIVGNTVLTVRTLPRHGWVEVISRRPSGLTKFLTHVENVPLAGPGEVDPDLFSVPTAIMMEKTDPKAANPEHSEDGVELKETVPVPPREDDEDLMPPDAITGYVWSQTAPSQRRKEVLIDPSFFALQLAPYPSTSQHIANLIRRIPDASILSKFASNFDRLPVIDTHRIGILYVAPGQTTESEILSNTYGSPFYTKFLEGIGRLINLRGQVDVYAGGLDPEEDGEYAYAWWDDIGQILFHTATIMPNHPDTDPGANLKKRHIGNDFVRIIWNDSGVKYKFDTLTTAFQFVNIVIEPHSLGSMAAFSSSAHENEYFKLSVQRGEGIPEFVPVGDFKIISAENLPVMVRQLSLLADWLASVWAKTKAGTERNEYTTNWMARLNAIRRFVKTAKVDVDMVTRQDAEDGIIGQESWRDFTNFF